MRLISYVFTSTHEISSIVKKKKKKKKKITLNIFQVSDPYVVDCHIVVSSNISGSITFTFGLIPSGKSSEPPYTPHQLNCTCAGIPQGWFWH